jgi:hypothetical protein
VIEKGKRIILDIVDVTSNPDPPGKSPSSEPADEYHADGRPPDWRSHVAVGKDLATVRWFGTIYHFTDKQARALRVLLDAFYAGLPDVHQSDLLKAAGVAEGKLNRLFSGCKAWDKVITHSSNFGGRPGYYRLVVPPAYRVERPKEAG